MELLLGIIVFIVCLAVYIKVQPKKNKTDTRTGLRDFINSEKEGIPPVNPVNEEKTEEIQSDEDFSDASILDKINNAIEERDKQERINIPSKKDLTFGPSSISSEEYNSLLKENDELKEELEKIKTEKSELDNQITSIKDENTVYKEKIEKLTTENNELKTNSFSKEKQNQYEMKAVKLNETIENLNAENHKYKKSLEAAANRLKELQEIIEEQKEARQAMIEGNKRMLNENKKIKEENSELINSLSQVHNKYNEQIKVYQDYVVELTSDIREFEEAYVAIGGDLHDVYEDYDDFE